MPDSVVCQSDESPKILFLGGLSGAGKSWFSSHCLAEEHNWLHIEIDVRGRDGIDVNGLRSPWDAFLAADAGGPAPRPRPLYEELCRRVGSFSGVVLSFSSCQVFQERHVQAAKGYFYFAYLYGPPDESRRAFLEREEKEARTVLGPVAYLQSYWLMHNQGLLNELNAPHIRDHLIHVMDPSGRRRDQDAIYHDVLKIIGDRT